MHNDDAQQQQAHLDPGTIARRLRSLPEETLQPYDWKEFRRRADEGRASYTAGMLGKYAAIAAAVVLVVVGLAVWSSLTRSDGVSGNVIFASGEPSAWGRTGTPDISGSTENSGDDGVATTGTAADSASAEPASRGVTPELRNARTKAAERWLASLPQEPVVVRVGTRAAVAGLEDRIAQLDDILSTARVEGAQPAHLTALQEQRAQLVNSLAQVRYAEALVYESR
jgi:hypothetical protein